ncbi:hypothetical protein KP509_1Z029400 [Ceratopteris richardii]|nr:hypothetical protein KP509_1Z029400 [Ceratopteris richardii]
MDLDFRGKHILAPMVRVGTLPFRMLAAEYGADITYGEELIDHKVVKCTREVNEALGTVDIVDKTTGEIVFRTCESERERVVCQFGTADATRALLASQLLSQKKSLIPILCDVHYEAEGQMYTIFCCLSEDKMN